MVWAEYLQMVRLTKYFSQQRSLLNGEIHSRLSRLLKYKGRSKGLWLFASLPGLIHDGLEFFSFAFGQSDIPKRIIHAEEHKAVF